MSDPKQIALVIDPVTARRLSSGIFNNSRRDKNYWLFNAFRPVSDLMEKLEACNPDGIISRALPEVDEYLRALNLPTVLVGGNKGGEKIVSVGSNNDRVGEMAAEHLMNIGLENFAYYGIESQFSYQRERGFSNALREKNFQSKIYVDKYNNWEQYYMEILHLSDESLRKWVDSLPKPVGIFAVHDPLGWHLLEVCRRSGIKVPEEVAVLGANNDELICHLGHPPLSSVSIPWGKIGGEIAMAMDGILDAQDNRGLRDDSMPNVIKVLPEGVVTRQSSDLDAVQNATIKQALRFIKNNISRPITVPDLIEEVKVSRRKLELDFRTHLGRTPKEEITRARVESAKLLLSQTDLSIPLVAERCGYMYPERFAVAFRKLIGMTPSAYRKQFRMSH
ncbi:substrate-binding domain-containing protein [Puniceicoccaceae bacterium K14]|nr:substrate-binding domain-containing protein [Puniceicoccaceae bacterium K14]